MTEQKIWQRNDGSSYLNQGPINPVQDVEAAHSMALAGEKARQEHAKATAAVNKSTEGNSPSDLPQLQKIAETDVGVVADRSEERVRSNIGGQDIKRGKKLFNLVQL